MRLLQKQFQINKNTQIFLLLFLISFWIFLFSSDAHRYTIDEHHTQQQSLRISTLEPDPTFILGESKLFFHTPNMNPYNVGDVCAIGILCYPASIGHSITQIPFIVINNNFNFISENTVFYDTDDFTDQHYNFWRNSINPNFTFLELFYGPLFTSLSTGLIFLISRSYNFNSKTSIIVSLLYGLTTTAWAYSNTSLNLVPEIFFLLLGFLYYRKFKTNPSKANLFLCSIIFGFAFLIRKDIVLIIIPIMFFLIYDFIKHKINFTHLLSYIFPIAIFYYLHQTIQSIKYTSSISSTESLAKATSLFTDIIINFNSVPLGIYGLFLSPGIGLFIFAPILVTIFFSFPDFYKKFKSESILFSVIIIFIALEYSYFSTWHGLVAWSTRYLQMTIPFLLIPLAASIESRSKSLIFPIIIILGGLGVFINILYVTQDVSWFVWSLPGHGEGLYGIADRYSKLYIHPATIWTFQYSQLTHSFILFFANLQPDIFLLKLFGISYFIILFTIPLALLSVILLKIRNIKN
jgi:hypothetical protein